MASYLELKIASKKLKMSEDEILKRKELNEIIYSKKTDKYDIDSILEKRTMTIGIDKYFNKEERKLLIENMKNYTKLKMKIFKKLQKNEPLKIENERIHRTIAKELNIVQVVADSALSDAQGLYNSTQSWKIKYEGNLAKSII